MSQPITVTLIGGPKECDGARFSIPSGMRHVRVPYTPGRRIENGPDDKPRAIGKPQRYDTIATLVALYGIEEIRFDYSIQFVAVHEDLKIGDAGRRLVEFYGRPIV
jgi:hypothetical protein